MSLTENALRKLQRDGLFAAGPATQPPADPQQPPTTTDRPAADESASDGTMPTSDPSESSAATELLPVDDAPEAGLPSQPTPLPEPVDAERPPEPDVPAYDPVIQSWEEAAPAPPPEYKAEGRDDDPASVDVTQQIDPADLPRQPSQVPHSQDTIQLTSGLPESWMDSPAGTDPSTDALGGSAASGRPHEPVNHGVDEAAPAEEFTAVGVEETATESQVTMDAKTPSVEPAAGGTASISLPYEQLVLDRLSQPDYAEPFLLLQNTLLRRCGFRLPASLFTVSPQATARSAEFVVHLSALWGASDKEILMVDANLEEQTLTRQLDALGQPGLCDILAGTCSAGDLVRPTSQVRLHFVPCGDDQVGISREPRHLDVQLLQQVLEHWCRQYHHVLIDVGPIGASLAMPLAELCEASLLVVCMQDVVLPQVQSAASALRNSNRSVLGCVLTDLPS